LAGLNAVQLLLNSSEVLVQKQIYLSFKRLLLTEIAKSRIVNVTLRNRVITAAHNRVWGSVKAYKLSSLCLSLHMFSNKTRQYEE